MERINYRKVPNTIDLVDLFFYILKKWKVLLIMFIIGALIGGGISYKKQDKDPASALRARAEKIDEEGISKVNQYVALNDLLLQAQDKKAELVKGIIEGSENESLKDETAICLQIIKSKKELDSSSQVLTDMETLISDLVASMSDVEKDYYTYTYKLDEYISLNTVGFSKKWPVIGAVLGVFLGAFWLLLVYVFDSHIKSEDELSVRYGLCLIGVLNPPKTKKGLTGLFEKWQRKGNMAAMSPENITAYLKTVDPLDKFICYDTSDKELDSFAKTLSAQPNIKLAGDLSQNADAPEMVKNKDGVILLIHEWKTSSNDLIHALDLLDGLNAKVFGAVVMR